MTNASFEQLGQGFFNPLISAAVPQHCVSQRIILGPHEPTVMCDCQKCTLERTFSSPHELGTPAYRLEYIIWKMEHILGMEPSVSSSKLPEVVYLNKIESIVEAYKRIVDITKFEHYSVRP